jgi:hypothetical protein
MSIPLPSLPETPYSLYYEWSDDEDGYGGSEVVDADGYTADQMHAHAAAVSAAKDAEIAGLRKINASQSVQIILQADRIKVLEDALRAIDKDAEIARLTAQMDAVRKWQERGEALFNRVHSMPVLFRLGAWWADRPWRDVPRIEP